MERRKIRRRIVLAILAVCLANPLTVLVVRDWWSCNFAVLQPGRIYRSGQMPASLLRRTIHDYGVRTVLNLRGVNAQEPWYVTEREATTASGATQVDVPMATDMWLTNAQLRKLIEILDDGHDPVLIHCEWGAERTGLVSALAELLRPGATLADARAQFSLKYLYYPDRQNRVLPAHLDQYEAWLHRQGCEHSPDRFRQWAAESFVPGSPNRGEWPFDPQPLVTITPPKAAAAARSDAEKTRR